MYPLNVLKHYVTGSIQRGEQQPIVAIDHEPSGLSADATIAQINKAVIDGPDYEMYDEDIAPSMK